MRAVVSCCMIAPALVFSLFIACPSGAHEDHGPSDKKLFTKHFSETLFDVTEHASYSAEVLLDDKEHSIGKNVIGIVIHGAHDEDVAGAELSIIHKNLATNENAAGAAIVKDKGNGLYIVSGLDLRREGRWEPAITIKKNGVKDSLKFVLPDALKERLPKGRYSP